MADSDDTREFMANVSRSPSSSEEGQSLEDGQLNESEEDSACYEVRPYQFQSERDEGQYPEENIVHDQAEQCLGATFSCTCENCSSKETVEECICCKEISVIMDIMEELNVDCIIDHPGFQTVCLDAAYYAYIQQYENHEEILSNYLANRDMRA